MTTTFIDPTLANGRIPGETATSLRHGLQRFAPQDADTFWMIDYRNPAGFMPLAMSHLELAYCRASKQVAEEGLIVGSDGYAVRLLGPFCYTAEQPLSDPGDLAKRSEVLRLRLQSLPETFDQTWQTARHQISAANRFWQHRDLTTLTKPQLANALTDALTHTEQVWTEHFRLMYPLLGLQSSFYAFADALGITRAEVADLMGGHRSTVTDCDLGFAALAIRARAFGIAPLLDGPRVQARLMAHGGLARAWWQQFTAFLDRFGWRADVVGDPTQPSWQEDPERPLHHIRALLRHPAPGQKLASLMRAKDQSRAVRAAIRARLSTPERAVFDQALADMKAANFVWWQEDHNPLIDLAALLPLRKVALAAAGALGLGDADDVLFCFAGELHDLLTGQRPLDDLLALILERKAWHSDWQARRLSLPRHFGPVPERVDDAIYSEIEGLSPSYLASLRGKAPTGCLHGTSASGGLATGRARVVLTDADLAAIEPGEILVCEGSTPAWTPVFGRISACLSDQGGTLSHTAIIAREYGLPCIVAMGNATSQFRTGDLIRVDASKGTAERLETA